MFSKTQLAHYLVHMVVANDGDLLCDDSLLPADVCVENDRERVRQLRDIIDLLYRSFDYVGSPEFAAKANGRSNSYREMLRKICSAAEKRVQNRKEYADALGELFVCDRAYHLTSPERHELIDNLKNGLAALANPDSQGSK